MSEAPCDEEHPEPVVVAVAEAAGDAVVELDEAVDGFGAAVVRAGGGEVGQERLAPLLQAPAEAGDLGDRAVGNEARTCSAIWAPSVRSVVWNASRRYWMACHAM